jgi:hypothetical protein
VAELRSQMQDRIARLRPRRGPSPPHRGGFPPVSHIAGLFLAGALLAGCSSSGDNPLTIFADPGQYQYSTCEQLTGQRQFWAGREKELKLLMDKADQGAGGAIVNVLAYKSDYIAAGEQLKVLEATARAKNCQTPSTWPSNSAVK